MVDQACSLSILTRYIIFYQESVAHFSLTDCDRQRHFHHSTRKLLVTEIPTETGKQNQLSIENPNSSHFVISKAVDAATTCLLLVLCNATLYSIQKKKYPERVIYIQSSRLRDTCRRH